MGIGVDITKNERFQKLIDEHKEARILSSKELKVYQEITSSHRKLEFLASRFASKEALFKASNIKFAMNNVSILNDEKGKPYVESPIFENVQISISHEKEYTISFVIV